MCSVIVLCSLATLFYGYVTSSMNLNTIIRFSLFFCSFLLEDGPSATCTPKTSSEYDITPIISKIIVEILANSAHWNEKAYDTISAHNVEVYSNQIRIKNTLKARSFEDEITLSLGIFGREQHNEMFDTIFWKFSENELVNEFN